MNREFDSNMTAPLEDAFEPTPTQQNMLVNSMRDPSRGVEIEQLVVHLGEKVDPHALRAAFEWAIAAHPALRSAFAWTSTSIEQRVLPAMPVPFETRVAPLDASFLEHDRVLGFDLTRAPLFRVTFASGVGEDAFVFTFHHAILDGRSYRAVIESVLDRLDGLPVDVPRVSFAAFCRELATRETKASVAYFGEVLEGVQQPGLPLPGTRVLPEGPLERIETRRATTDLSALIARGKTVGFTLADSALGAWAWVLARFPRSEDIVIGPKRSGRIPAL